MTSQAKTISSVVSPDVGVYVLVENMSWQVSIWDAREAGRVELYNTCCSCVSYIILYSYTYNESQEVISFKAITVFKIKFMSSFGNYRRLVEVSEYVYHTLLYRVPRYVINTFRYKWCMSIYIVRHTPKQRNSQYSLIFYSFIN